MALDLRNLRTAGRMSEDEYDARMKVARRKAMWEIGDPSWAGVIIAAFMDPEATTAALDADDVPLERTI